MIVFANPFRENKAQTSADQNDVITFTFKNTTLALTRKDKKIFDRLRCLKKIKSVKSKKDENIPSYSHSLSKNVYKSKFDKEDILEDFDYECKYEYDFDYECNHKYDFYKNKLFSINNNKFNEIDNKSLKHKKLLLDQIQLIIQGYDILIPDFMIQSMTEIAETFCFEDLINAMNPLKEEMQDFANYDRFSELELLETLQNSLLNIDEKYNDKTSIFKSLLIYTGKSIFKETMSNIINIFPEKQNLITKLSKELFKEKIERSCFNYDPYYRAKGNGEKLIPLIQNDDINLLQKMFINQQFDFSNIEINLSNIVCIKMTYLLNKTCSVIECAAFFGSIKCFKFLLLNSKTLSKDIIKYAICGGNNEIIHICESNKCNFDGSMKIAIRCFQNEIAQWLIENKKEDFSPELIKECLHASNFQLIPFLLDHYEYDSRKEKLFKYIVYINQFIKIQIFSYDKYFMKFPCIDYTNENGLIYCSDDKIKLLDILLPRYLDDCRTIENNILFNTFYSILYF